MLLCAVSAAQSIIRSDETLENEASIVEPFDVDVDLITEGATRDQNLFHSFETFGVGEGRAAYFITESDAIINIFCSVTGGSISEVQGILGIRGRGANQVYAFR